MASEVLDASAFYSGTAFLSGRRGLTTSSVIEEVRHVKSIALDGLIAAGNLQIVDPEQHQLIAVKKAADKTGDVGKLSKADISVLALAAQLAAVLVTDDYALANVAATMGVKVSSSSGKGLRQIRKWTSYCSACGKKFDSRKTECPLCGNRLRRNYKVSRPPNSQKASFV